MTKQELLAKITIATNESIDSIEELLEKEGDYFISYLNFPEPEDRKFPRWLHTFELAPHRFAFSFMGYDFVVYPKLLIQSEVMLFKTYNVVNRSRNTALNDYELNHIPHLDFCIGEGKYNTNPVYYLKTDSDNKRDLGTLTSFYKELLLDVVRKLEDEELN